MNLGLADENVHAVGLSRTNDLLIYAGTNEGQRGVYRTTDGGKVWLPFNNGLGELDLRNMAVEFSGTDSIAYASSIYTQHVWKTLDGGITWRNRLTGSVCGNTQLVMDPGDARRLYVSNCDGVRRTQDAADSTPWTIVGPAGITNPRIAIARSNPAVVYFLEDKTVYRSANHGTTTATLPAVVGPEEEVGVQYVLNDLAVHSTNENIVYVATNANGVFKSADAGSTWLARNHLLPNQGQGFSVRLIAVDPVDGEKAYIYGVGSATATVEQVTTEVTGFFRTTDGGATWSAINNGFPAGVTVNSLLVPESGAREPIAGTFSGLWRYSESTVEDGDLIKSSAASATSGAVYRIVDGKKQPITGFNVFVTCGYRAADVNLLPEWYVQAIPDGPEHAACGNALDYDVPGGRLYTQAGPGGGRGYSVTDNFQISFFGKYQALGGPAALGFPISRRYYDGAFTLQAFQRGVLQWNPANRIVNVLNLFDDLSAKGFDPWLLANRQIPGADDWSNDQGLAFDDVLGQHLELLERNAAIMQRFLLNPLWLQDFGLPMGYAELGSVRVLRAQRAVLIEQNGIVTIANSGEIAKSAGYIPVGALNPN